MREETRPTRWILPAFSEHGIEGMRIVKKYLKVFAIHQVANPSFDGRLELNVARQGNTRSARASSTFEVARAT